MEDHNNTEIKKVSGGFGIKLTMAAGDSDCDWETTVDGNLILLFGGEKTGTITAGT